MGWVGAVGAGFGGAMGAASAISAGREQAKVASYNRKLLSYEKKYALEKAKFEAGRLRREGEKTVSKQTVAFAKAGITPDSDTMLAVIADTEYEYELDAKIIEYGGDIDAWRIDQQRQSLKNEGRRAERSSYLKAFSSLLGGVTNAANSMQVSRLLQSSTSTSRTRAPQAERPM